MTQIITKDLRELLKLTLQEEIENLPSYLQTLNEKDRLNIIIKLMPFVFPKIESNSSNVENKRSNPTVEGNRFLP